MEPLFDSKGEIDIYLDLIEKMGRGPSSTLTVRPAQIRAISL